jgi:hypothetical protein
MNEQHELPLRAAYPFGVENGLEKEIEAIRDIVIEWDLPYSSSLRKGYVVALFESRGIFGKFKAAHWPVGNTPQGEKKRQRYLRLKQRYEDFLEGRRAEPDPEAEVADDIDENQSFAAETDLRDFLAKYPSRIEVGLTVYQDGERSGVEYSIDDGRIDILAMDRDKRFVVIGAEGRQRAQQDDRPASLLHGVGGQESRKRKELPRDHHRERDNARLDSSGPTRTGRHVVPLRSKRDSRGSCTEGIGPDFSYLGVAPALHGPMRTRRDQTRPFRLATASDRRQRISHIMVTPTSAVLPLMSKGGETSTTSPPTRSSPRRPRSMRCASCGV